MQIGNIGRVPIRMSVWLLPVLVLAIWVGDGMIILLGFVCISLHEAAHAAVAHWMGLQVLEIQVMPFGGVARLASTVERGPGAEVAVAAAGPAASLLFAWGLSYLVSVGWLGSRFWMALVQVNMQLALFNLLPALPLDGGRVLRALLSPALGWAKATRIAGIIGMVLGFALLGIGAIAAFSGVWNVTVLASGIFLVLAAWREGRDAAFVLGKTMVLNQRNLRRGPIKVRQLAASATSPLHTVARNMVPGEYHTVRVLDDDLRPIGTLDEGNLVTGIADKGASATLRELLEP